MPSMVQRTNNKVVELLHEYERRRTLGPRGNGGAILTSRNNIMQKEKSSPSRSNQPSNVPNYVTIATREAPLRALKSYPPQLFGSY